MKDLMSYFVRRVGKGSEPAGLVYVILVGFACLLLIAADCYPSFRCKIPGGVCYWLTTTCPGYGAPCMKRCIDLEEASDLRWFECRETENPGECCEDGYVAVPWYDLADWVGKLSDWWPDHGDAVGNGGGCLGGPGPVEAVGCVFNEPQPFNSGTMELRASWEYPCD